MSKKSNKNVTDPTIEAAEKTSRRGLIGVIVAAVIAVVGGIAVAFINGWFASGKPSTTPDSSIYRVRVTVIDPQNVPVEDAKVWSSFGGEPKRVAGGWQFDIPNASRPKDGKLTIFSSKESAFISGKQDIQLGDDPNPTLTIKLSKDTSATVRGIIQDSSGRAVSGVRVFVVGYGEEAVITQAAGSFPLPAHASINEQVLLHAEKKGLQPAEQLHPAGIDPATIILEKHK